LFRFQKAHALFAEAFLVIMVLKQILEKIPESDQDILRKKHGIDCLDKLVGAKPSLEKCELQGVHNEVQVFLGVVCSYLESLDSPSYFAWEGFENFCGYNDFSGDDVLDLVEEVRVKKKESQEDSDPNGYNLTAEERKQLQQFVENDPLTLKISGFSPRSLQFEMENNKHKDIVEDLSSKTEVAFNGSVFYVKRCYNCILPNGESVVVGIHKFTRVSRFR
jgi:hypothetical protein